MTSSPFETLLDEQAGPLTGRLTRMLGDRELAQDLRQETLLRAWRSAPREASPEQLRAWLHRTATHLALDELRRRARRGTELGLDEELDATTGATAAPGTPGEARPVREALATLTPHERLLLLLRFEAGLSLREVGSALALSEDAARKRISRARVRFARALRVLEREETRPTIAVLLGEEDPGVYRTWLQAAGARVKVIDSGTAGLDLAGVDGLVLSGSEADIHPATYRERMRPEVRNPDLWHDRRDLAALRIALTSDLPIVGICRGAQLLNVLYGGTLHQHLPDTGAGTVDHREEHHVRTHEGSRARHLFGDRAAVVSEHHQAVRDLAPGLRVTSVAPDGLPESLEVPGKRLALGVQWHPERVEGARGSEASALLAAALVEAASCAA